MFIVFALKIMKVVNFFDQRLHFGWDMMQTVETTQNPEQQFYEYFRIKVFWIIMGPDKFCLDLA